MYQVKFIKFILYYFIPLERFLKIYRNQSNIKEYTNVLGNLKVEKIKEEKIEDIILSNTRKISEDFERAYKIEKRHSNKSIYYDINSSFENETKQIEDTNKTIIDRNHNNSNNNENLNIEENNMSFNSRSDKSTIIDYVFEAPDDYNNEKFSIHNNYNTENLNNYSYPFGK